MNTNNNELVLLDNIAYFKQLYDCRYHWCFYSIRRICYGY